MTDELDGKTNRRVAQLLNRLANDPAAEAVHAAEELRELLREVGYHGKAGPPVHKVRSAAEAATERMPALRPTPAEWARRRRAERAARRKHAAAAMHLRLGPAWHLVDWPLPGFAWAGTEYDVRERFLAFGPGGVYAVLIVDHGWHRVALSGDIVQVDNKRPPYLPEARRTARQASQVLSAAAGQTVRVDPVVAFDGSGVISVHGLPKDCLVSGCKDLDKLLLAGGSRISPATAEKLAAAASRLRATG
ncbi:hypothetical protein AB0F81_24240 [Actinoplanes sp. NPDC024001]|uniref:hypothetical protein n=1 Tax=Actinoplanes sp. NPDC024001 TaxID=3154598 RepID=UPI0033FC4532